MQFLIIKQLSPLNLDKIKIKTDYKFIEIDKLKYKIQEFLHLYLGKTLRIEDFYNRLLIPLFEELGVRRDDYNP
jgi:hypothetical protein